MCKALGVASHPARYPAKLPEFFIKFLTEPNDLVVDVFGGSNTTGYVCEAEGRNWLSFEERHDYLAASVFRFIQNEPMDRVEAVYKQLMEKEHPLRLGSTQSQLQATML